MTYLEAIQFVTYWQHLDIMWPQQAYTKGGDNPKTSQDTI